MNIEKVDNNWVHFISIGGVTMAPLAKAFQEQGFTVSGSDNELYEPVKGFVKKSRLKFFEGFNYKNLVNRKGQYPGLVVCGSGVSLKNKEYLFARKQNLNIRHFARVLEELVVNNNSIVVAGTYGKTSVTAMLVRIFEKAGKHVSYMYGALPVDGRSSVKFKDYNTNFSVVEGDEYIASRWDPKSKFFYFHPDYLVLNAIQWDHTDVFKTEREYIQNFEKLVQEVPQSGIIFANVGDANVRKVVKGAKCKVVDFDVEMLNAWGVENSIKTDLVGKFNRINLYLACFIAEKLNVPLKVSKKAVSKYKGIKRRLEIKYDKKGFVVVDDFASSAPKVNGSLESVQDSFPNHKIVAIFEPNVGNRTESALKTFKSVFSSADLVLLPKFSEIVKSNNYPMKNTTLAEFLSNNGVSSKSFESDNELIDAAFEFGESHKQVVFVFLSSHGMETRIDALINAVKHRK